MIPDYIIQKFNKGIIIIHPSLLPKYRGGAPIFHAIANGDKSSGISYI
jgi:methionyl-tRNA formyltransferase